MEYCLFVRPRSDCRPAGRALPMFVLNAQHLSTAVSGLVLPVQEIQEIDDGHGCQEDQVELEQCFAMYRTVK